MLKNQRLEGNTVDPYETAQLFFVFFALRVNIKHLLLQFVYVSSILAYGLSSVQTDRRTHHTINSISL